MTPPGTTPELRESLAALFPDFIAWHWSRDAGEAGPLTGTELAQAREMSEKRLDMFRLGRHCARKALEASGHPSAELPIGPGRAPLWPPGYVGSITHTSEHALAAVAPLTEISGLGIDVEARGELEPAVRRLICREDELPALGRLGEPDIADPLLFSAKESVFKCIWPTVRRYVDFRELALIFEPGTHAFRIATADRLPDSLCDSLRGSYRVSDAHIATLAYIDSSRVQD